MVVHKQRAPYDVYVGRPTEWGNPYVIGPDGTREEVVAKYRAHLWRRLQADPGLVQRVASLHGKTLACWCAPEACHADVLVAASEWAARLK